jgi:phenylalanyl-tRNA synthetase beta chain
MLVPLKWLGEFVDHGLSPEELAHALTMGGLEIDAVEERFTWAGKVVTAKVLTVEPHPDADKLRLALVDTGSSQEKIVCGAPNLYEGMVGALALVGADFGEGMVVKKAKIRGVESRGMLCSERELDLSDDHSGIMELDEALEPGLDLIDALNLEDMVMEMSITPNRGDALSILGIARDLAAITGRPLTMPTIEIEEHQPSIESDAAITVADPDGCPRYVGRLVRGVKIGPSPLWMRDRLRASGVRPINNVVDVTNYVLMERGQPLHGFDFARLAGGRIHVRVAEEGERFTTLDDQERKLEAGMLLICDGEKPVALAGVMGGLNSEIEEDTEDVLIESAFFSAINTRRTSKRLGLSTEASYRFERGVDQEGCAIAADRAAQLMAQLADGKVAAGVLDVYPKPYQAPELPLSVSRTAKYLGLPLSREQVVEPLERLGLKVEIGGDPDYITVQPPAARTDLERMVDLTEEVARMVGFDNIPAKLPWAPLSALPRAWNQVVRERSRDLMCGLGFDEAINLSFAHPRFMDRLRLTEDDPRRLVVKLMNPLSEDQSVLRTTLLPGLLTACRRNVAFSVPDTALFEVGKVFWQRNQNSKLPQEPARLGGVLCGLAAPVSWWSGEQTVNLAHSRGAVEYLLNGLGLKDLSFPVPKKTPPYFEPGTFCQVFQGKLTVGELGKVHPKVAAAYDLDVPVYAFEMDFDLMVELAPAGKAYTPLPRYPEVVRDVAIVVDEAVGAGDMLAVARAPKSKKANKWLSGVELFDLYRGKPLEKDQKSIAFRFRYRSPERTLTEDQVIPAHDDVVQELLERFQGILRQ